MTDNKVIVAILGSDTYENIKKIKELKDLPLIRQSRLSVMQIDTKSWKIILKMGSIS